MQPPRTCMCGDTNEGDTRTCRECFTTPGDMGAPFPADGYNLTRNPLKLKPEDCAALATTGEGFYE